MDGDHQSDFRPTTGKVLASLWVMLWIGIAYQAYGGIIAARVGGLFGLLLSFIWFPDLFSKLQLPIHQRDAGALGPVPATFLKFVAWMFLVGLPSAWLLLWRDSG